MKKTSVIDNDDQFSKQENQPSKKWIDGARHIQQFSSVAEEKEQKILNYIYSQMAQQYFSFTKYTEDQDDDQPAINQPNIDPTKYSDFITNVIDSGYYSAPGSLNGTASYRTVLIGPPKSGKTTMLKMISKRVYQNLIQSGESREVFVFNLDFRRIRYSFSSLQTFYQTLVHEIIEQIGIQWPLINAESPNTEKQFIKDSSYAPSLALSQSTVASSASTSPKKRRKKYGKESTILQLREFFNQFVDYSGRFEPLSSKFPQTEPFQLIAVQINNLGHKIADSLNNKSKKPFFTVIATLPIIMAKIFNFKRIHYVFDHVDEVENSDTTVVGNFNLATCVKLMLSQGSFVISCTDENHIFDFCESCHEDDVDLTSSSNFVSIIDSCNEKDVPACTFHFELKFAQVSKPVLLQIQDCGRCGGYLSLWSEIQNYSAPIIRQNRGKGKTPDTDSVEKAKLKVLMLLRHFAPLILMQQDKETLNPSQITAQLESFEIKTNQRGE